MGASAVFLRGEKPGVIRGGADIVSASVRKILEERYGRLRYLYLDEAEPVPGRILGFMRAATGRYPSYSPAASTRVGAAVIGAKLLFIDSSVYGLACAEARRVNPGIKCVVLFHNIERRFYLRQAVHARRLRNLVLLPAIIRAERAAVRGADLVIVLSDRDASELESDYGRRPDLILPPMLEDRFRDRVIAQKSLDDGLRMLIVGSAFPPNLGAARWFVREVLPEVHGKLSIVGNGFDAYEKELASDRVAVKGLVPDLRPYYEEADCVVSPIRWGSGIKVKTAEALMYGMPFVGSAESLVGYDPTASGAILAGTREEYIAALGSLGDTGERSLRSSVARAYYHEALSPAVGKRALIAALDEMETR